MDSSGDEGVILPAVAVIIPRLIYLGRYDAEESDEC